MDNQNFYLKISGAAISVILAASALILNTGIRGLTAAAFTAAAAVLIRSAEKSSRKTGRTDRMKATLKAVKPAAELILISSGLISYSPTTTVSTAVIGLVSFSEIFSRGGLESQEFFGQEVRTGLLILTFIGLTFNEYILFYGLIAVGLVAAFDSLYMLYESMDTGF
ncbi:MAG: hypothetical protein ABEJ87_04450 [Candidatus Nanohalobium sp.]